MAWCFLGFKDKLGAMMMYQMLSRNAQKSLLAMSVVFSMNAMASEAVVEVAQKTTDESVSLAADEAVVAVVSETPIKNRAEGEALFYECASVVSDSARLACFDSLAQGKTPSMLQKKQPIALGQTMKNAVSGNRQVVFADADVGEVGHVQVYAGSQRYTPLSLSYDLDKNSEQGLWRVRPHNPMYILPMYFNGKPNRHPGTPNQPTESFTPQEYRAPELKFQVSLKSKMMEDVFGTNADLWFGYTHIAHWQIYNERESRPFRAHDYEPEVFLTQPVAADLPWGGKLRMLGAGAVHHSNGEDDPMSRSWNRAYAMAGMEWGKLTVMPRAWVRLLKKDGAKPDDNPDILDYYGYGDVKFLYQMDDNRHLSGLARYNPMTGKGALQLDYVRPIGKGIGGYVQIFHGYGQSIIDYNHKSTSIGVGVMLNDWMGL